LILLTIGLIACRGTLVLRLATSALLPFVVLALVANQRRVGYFALAFGLLLAGVLFVADRRLRWPALLGGALAAAVIAVYAAVFWNADESDTPLALPVYAVRSISEPKTMRDVESNQWRLAENENIERSIRSEPLLGFGFGQRYYNWFGLRLNTQYDYWQYATHNAIYWMWMKLGAVGFVLFWHLVASAMVLGVLAFRRLTDGDLRAAALMAVGLVAMQMIFSYADLGLNSSTSMAFFGAMLGLIASLDRLAVEGGGRWRR
jgi:hypothetical protein